MRLGMPVSDSSQDDAPGERVDLGGGVALVGPAVAQHRVGAGVGGAAERPPVAEQVPHGRVDDLMGGPLGSQDDDHPGGAAAGDQVAGERGELRLLLAVPDRGGEVGVLVDDDQVDGFPGVGG